MYICWIIYYIYHIYIYRYIELYIYTTYKINNQGIEDWPGRDLSDPSGNLFAVAQEILDVPKGNHK